MALGYARPSVLNAGRIIEGEARILPGRGQVLWVEAQSHVAEFEGFTVPDAATSCG